MKSRLQLLREWRRVVEILVDIVKELYPDARVYLFGGAAEDRLTVLSDIDVLVVLREKLDLEKKADVLAKLWEKLEERGIPLHYPLEIHVVDEQQFQHYARKASKLVKLYQPSTRAG